MSNPYTYEFSVTGIKVRDQVNTNGEKLPSAVVQTYWKIIATDADGDQEEYAGATPFTAENVPAGSFTSFEDLTESDVTSWIEARINGDRVYSEHIKEHFDKRFDESKGHLRTVNMPWATEEEVTPPLPDDADSTYTTPDSE